MFNLKKTEIFQIEVGTDQPEKHLKALDMEDNEVKPEHPLNHPLKPSL